MKPLKFKDVSPDRILDYDAMSKIRGGIDDYGWWGTGTCGIKYWDFDGYTVRCNMSLDELKLLAETARKNGPYWWCCDSCVTSTYCSEAAGGGY